MVTPALSDDTTTHPPALGISLVLTTNLSDILSTNIFSIYHDFS